MPNRRVTTQEKRLKGTYKPSQDDHQDFTILDGLYKMNPKAPKDFTPDMVELWNRAWRHLVKHGYGKEIDKELVKALVWEWFNYEKYRQFDHTAHLAEKALKNYRSMSDALCLNPNALGKAAVLQKKEKSNKLEEAIGKFGS